MDKFLIDLHTHTTFSHDGKNTPSEMLETAYHKGISFFGISDHFDYDYDETLMTEEEYAKTRNGGVEEYFHTLRHLQEDYEGAMNVSVGAEFGFSVCEHTQKKYLALCEKYRPDYVINSVHGEFGRDYARTKFIGDKLEIYKSYLNLVRKSLDVPYPYDVVGHIGYVARYVPFEDKRFDLAECGKELDDIFLTIIQKNKILEVNTANKKLENKTMPSKVLLERYFQLGGRKICFGSDAHFVERVGDKWTETVEMLKSIGFTHFTVPHRGIYTEVAL